MTTRKTVRIIFATFIFLLSIPSLCRAGDTIVAQETDRYFYKDGKILRYEGQMEYTYYLDMEKDLLTRTRIYDRINRKVTPDETVYHIEKQLLSHPTSSERYVLLPVIRAVGQTDSDTVELLAIESGFVNIVTSTNNEMVLSRAKRLK